VTVMLRVPSAAAQRPSSEVVSLLRLAPPQRMPRRRFPAPIRLGSNAVGWVASEVDEWIDQRIGETRRATVER